MISKPVRLLEKKHNIRKMTISGESGNDICMTADSWKERMPEIIQGYATETVWNLDECGVFYFLTKALGRK